MADSILDVKAILNEYSKDIQDGIVKIAQSVAKEDAKKLRDTRDTYKVRSGKYNKGWAVKTEKGRNTISCIVHNKTNYQLTHLLEKGHKIIGRNGSVVGQSRAFPHIAPVEEISNREYEQEVARLIESGG